MDLEEMKSLKPGDRIRLNEAGRELLDEPFWSDQERRLRDAEFVVNDPPLFYLDERSLACVLDGKVLVLDGGIVERVPAAERWGVSPIHQFIRMQDKFGLSCANLDAISPADLAAMIASTPIDYFSVSPADFKITAADLGIVASSASPPAAETPPCTCDSRVVFDHGCTCGAMARERAARGPDYQ